MSHTKILICLGAYLTIFLLVYVSGCVPSNQEQLERNKDLIYQFAGVFNSADWVEIIGYGIANLGYLLLLSGIIKGTFIVFRLTKRWEVITASVLLILLGNMLLNI